MKKPNKKHKSKAKLRLPALLLFSILIYLIYYQLWHHSKQVNGKIYVLNKSLNAHLADVWTVKFSPDGNSIASGSVDSTVKIWNKKDGKIILNLKQPNGITSLDFSPDGNYLVTGSYDAVVRLWKLPEGLLVKKFIGHTGTVWSVNFSPDGKSIASCGEDSTIKLWEVESGKNIRVLRGHSRNVWDVRFSPDGNTLASGSFDKTVRIWSLKDGNLLKTITGHSEAVVAIAFSPDGEKLVSTSDDKTIKLWNTRNWNLIYTLEVPEHNQAADFSPDNKLLITGGRDKPALGEFLQNILGDSEYNRGISMRLWDTQSGRLLQTFSIHSNDVNDISFSSDGKWIASASSDKTVKVWQFTNPEIKRP